MGFLDNTGLSTVWAKAKALFTSKASPEDSIKNITRSGTTFTFTKANGTTSTLAQQDNDTTYSAGTGLKLDSTTFNLNGATSRNTLGLGNTTGVVPVANGGTGTNSLSTLLTNCMMRKGTITVSNLARSQSVDKSVTFTATTNTPVIIITLGCATSDTRMTDRQIFTEITAVSKTGFTVRVHNASSVTTSRTLYWFAIGT